jgi:hypothetical protein
LALQLLDFNMTIFKYDGPPAPTARTHGHLRYVVDDELGLMWCASDLVKLIGLTGANSTQLQNLAPEHTKLVAGGGRARLPLRFTTHSVVKHWLSAPVRLEHMPTARALDEWAIFRKFPISPAPSWLKPHRVEVPRSIQPAVDDPSHRVKASRVHMTQEQRQEERFHRAVILDDKTVYLLYVAEDEQQPDRLSVYVSWASAFSFMSEGYNLTPSSHLGQIQRFFRESRDHIRRERAVNREDVVVVSLRLFEHICAVWGAHSAQVAIIKHTDKGRSLTDQWRDEATRYGNRQKEFRDMQPPGRRAPIRRDEIESPRATRAPLQTSDWNPRPYESLKAQERNRAEAEQTAQKEMGSYSEMLKNIKPE